MSDHVLNARTSQSTLFHLYYVYSSTHRRWALRVCLGFELKADTTSTRTTPSIASCNTAVTSSFARVPVTATALRACHLAPRRGGCFSTRGKMFRWLRVPYRPCRDMGMTNEHAGRWCLWLANTVHLSLRQEILQACAFAYFVIPRQCRF